MENMDIDYAKEVSGRCHRCNIRYIWKKGKPKLKDAICPNCGQSRLRATTHLFKGPSYRLPGGLPNRKKVEK